MDGWVDEWMDWFVGGWTDRWMDGLVGGGMDLWMDGWINGWINGWTNGRVNDGWMHARPFQSNALSAAVKHPILLNVASV